MSGSTQHRRRSVRAPAALLPALLVLLSHAGCAPDEPESDAVPDADARETAFRDAFEDRASRLGVDFRHRSGARGDLWMPETTGSGAALIDHDGDGDLDLYLVQGGWLDDRPDGPSDRLFRNELRETGRLGFRDVTGEAGLLYPRGRGRGYGQGVAVGDFDRDGDEDLFVTAFGPDRLLRNEGGRFEEVPGAGWEDAGWSTSALFVDLVDDPAPQLYVARYIDYSLGSHKDCWFTVGTPDYCMPLSYTPVSDRLYVRESGSFADVSQPAGLTAVRGSGLGVVAADFDRDGRTEILVANDQMANHLWVPTGSRALREDASLAGVALNGEGMAEASMGIAVADFDRDGHLDLVLSHLEGESHTLYRGLGGGLFDDASDRSRLTAATLGATGFGIVALDFDNDGWVDLAAANGAVHLDPRGTEPLETLPLDEPDQLLRNVEGSFEPVEATAFGGATVGRGVAVGDLDDDGDPDLVFNDSEGPARILVNRIGQDRSWIGVSLVDAEGLDPGEGLAVTLETPELRHTRLRQRGGSYLSASDPRVLFGLADRRGAVDVTVHWADGTGETFGSLETGRYHRLQQGRGRPTGEGS